MHTGCFVSFSNNGIRVLARLHVEVLRFVSMHRPLSYHSYISTLQPVSNIPPVQYISVGDFVY